MKTDKQKYLDWTKSLDKLPVFYQGWWLDAVTVDKNWNAVVAEKNNNVVAALVYVIQKTGIFTFIKMPKLTPYLGPYIQYPQEQKYASCLAFEKEVLTQLINKLPVYDKFNLAFSPKINNWLPFYWHGFKQTTRYTYILKNDTTDNIFAGLQGNIRREIRKAKKNVTIQETQDIEKFFNLNQMTFERQKIKSPVSFAFLRSLDEVLNSKNCRKILIAEDASGRLHSSAYFVFDSQYVYYLMGGSDSQLRNSGAASLLMWEGIKFAMESGKNFNFEGSMHEPIERFFRAFGAVQTAYFKITRLNSRLSKLIHAFK